MLHHSHGRIMHQGHLTRQLPLTDPLRPKGLKVPRTILSSSSLRLHFFVFTTHQELRLSMVYFRTRDVA